MTGATAETGPRREQQGVERFDEILIDVNDVEYVPAPELNGLDTQERETVAERLEPYEASRRSAKKRGSAALFD